MFFVYAALDADGDDFETVFSYVVTALQADQGVLPYPQPGEQWTEGHEVRGLTDGDLEAGRRETVTLVVPGAVEVVVKTENKQIPLHQVSDAGSLSHVVCASDILILLHVVYEQRRRQDFESGGAKGRPGKKVRWHHNIRHFSFHGLFCIIFFSKL